MKEEKGFIGISRCIVAHWIYQDADYFKVWFEMIYRARYSIEPVTRIVEGQLITINRGEFIFGRKSWSDRLGVGEQRLRTLINKLVKDNMIELVKKYNKFTIYKIINYEKYNQQGNQQKVLENEYIGNDGNQQDNQQPTDNQPTANQQLTTKEQSSNKGNKENNIYNNFVKILLPLYPGNKNKSTRDKKLPKIINEYGEEQIIRCINRYADTVKNTDKQYILNEGTFWNGRYIDYLDENYTEVKSKKEIKDDNPFDYRGD